MQLIDGGNIDSGAIIDANYSYFVADKSLQGKIYKAHRVSKCVSMGSETLCRFTFVSIIGSDYTLGSPVDDCLPLKECLKYVMKNHGVKEIYCFSPSETEQMGTFLKNRLG